MSILRRAAAGPLAALILVPGSAVAASGDFGAWSAATRVESASGTAPAFNGLSLDGCPFISRDGKTFYMASNRPGGLGGIDIWVSTRASASDPWGAPANVGAPVNSPDNDFCPTISRDGHRFFFVSNRAGGCGGDDIYTTRLRPEGWDPVENLGCHGARGPNSAGNEASPFPLPERDSGPTLYFSSTRAGSPDIYLSRSHGGAYGPAEAVNELNTGAADAHPNLRRDGLEIFFFSNRSGAAGNDIYSATRASTADPWSTPVNLGTNVNSAASETRPSLSWDGTTLYFGSNRAGGEGDSDHYVTTRDRLLGSTG
jgi:Tol biopolymer transport system component